jgi:transglutaminase-like putative cysteine protease
VPLRRLQATFLRVSCGVLCLAACYALPAYGGDRFQPVSPEELKMTGDPQAPGAEAIILYRQVDRDDTYLHAHEDNYFRIKILTEEGRKHADIEIPFFKQDGNNINNIKARTIRPDGSIVNFDGKVFEKSIAKAQGLKYLAKTFTLPDVQVGSIIEYYYTIDLSEHYLYDSRWILSNELFIKHAKFSLKPYSDNGMSVRWSWQGLPAGAAQPKDAGGFVRLEVNNIPAFHAEDYMPPEDELKARVDFAYSEEAFEKDPVQYWKKAGKKLNDHMESFVGKRKAMEEAVAQIVSPADSPEVKLQKIYARVQQMRNTTFEVSKTEQEKKRENQKEASNVEDLWKRGYGNATELTWLFLGLARAAGFDASGVLVSDRQHYFFRQEAMDANKLDDNVILVKLNGQDIYCDPGVAFTPFGLLEWAETGVQGLRLDKNGGTWIQTVLPPGSASRIERHANLTLSAATGGLEGKLTITFTGLEGMRRRLEERHDDEADRKKFLENQAKEYIPAASEVELKNKPDWNDSSKPLIAEYDVKIPGWGAGAGRRVLLPVGIFSATEKHVFDHAERVFPIYFEFPFEKVDDVTIALPPGWQVSSVPPEENQDGKLVGYQIKAEGDKQTLHLTRKLRVEILLIDPKSYPTLRGFFQIVRKGDEQQVVLLPGGTNASN